MKIHHQLVVTLVLACSLASADNPKAAEHVAAAKKAFAEGRYTDAIVEFRAANALQPDPKLLYSIAQAQRMSGDCAAAIVTYQDLVKTKADPKLVEFSEANIARCKEQLAKEPPKPPEPAPEPPSAALPPSTAQPLPAGPEPRDTQRTWTSDWIGHALVGGGVGIAVVGTIVWIGGRNAANKANDATDHDDFIAARDAASSAVTKQRIGLVMGIAGVGLVAGGIVHYKLRAKRELAVGAVPTAGGGAITARLRF